MTRLKYFALGLLASLSLVVLAQTRILELDVLGDLDVVSAGPNFLITETDAAADNGIWLTRAVAEQWRFEACTDALSCPDIMTVDRTGSTVDTINLSPTTLQHNGVDLTVEEGTFEITWETACTTTPSQTFDYVRHGNVVTLKMVDSVACTSDSTSFTSTDADIPASLRPAQFVVLGPLGVVNNTTEAEIGCLNISVAGIPTIRRASGSPNTPCNISTWTASGSKIIGSPQSVDSFSYIISNP